VDASRVGRVNAALDAVLAVDRYWQFRVADNPANRPMCRADSPSVLSIIPPQSGVFPTRLLSD